MCVLVRYVSPIDKKVKTHLLELELDATDCISNNIFKTFKTFLERKEIPIKNIIGMVSDNASIMTGCSNSFFSRLKSEIMKLHCQTS